MTGRLPQPQQGFQDHNLGFAEAVAGDFAQQGAAIQIQGPIRIVATKLMNMMIGYGADPTADATGWLLTPNVPYTIEIALPQDRIRFYNSDAAPGDVYVQELTE